MPESERWLHEPAVRERIDRAFAWAAENPPEETALDELEERIEEGKGGAG